MDYSEENKRRWIEAELERMGGAPPESRPTPGVPFKFWVNPEDAGIPEESKLSLAGLLSSGLKGAFLGHLGKTPETMSPEQATAYWAAEQAGGFLPMLATGGLVGAGLKGAGIASKLGKIGGEALKWGMAAPLTTGLSKEGIETAKQSPVDFIKMLLTSGAIGGALGGLGGAMMKSKIPTILPEAKPIEGPLTIGDPMGPQSLVHIPRQPEVLTAPPTTIESLLQQSLRGEMDVAPPVPGGRPAIGRTASISVSPTGEATIPSDWTIPTTEGMTPEQIQAARGGLAEPGRIPTTEEAGVVEPSIKPKVWPWKGPPSAEETLTSDVAAAEQSSLAQEKATANAVLQQDNPLTLGGITPQSWKAPWEGFVDRMLNNARFKVESILSKSPFLTNLAKGIWNHFGWPEGYLQLKNMNFGEFQSKMFDIMATAKKLKGEYTPEELGEIQKLIETEIAKRPEMSPKMKEGLVKLALSQNMAYEEALKLGMINPESYYFYMHQALPRFYESKIGRKITERFATGMSNLGIEGSRLGKRGPRGTFNADIDMAQVERFANKGWTIRGIFVKGADGKDIPELRLFDETLPREQRTLQATQKINEIRQSMGDIVMGLAERAEMPEAQVRRLAKEMPNDLRQLIVAKGYQAAEIDPVVKTVHDFLNYKVKMWQDIPEEIRTELGEIKDPLQRFVRGQYMLLRDIQTEKLFRLVKANGWARPEEPPQGAVYSEQWEQLPKEFRYGSRAEEWGSRPIYDDITRTMRLRTDMEKASSELVSFWKAMRVVDNPATQFRNLMTNWMLNDIGGLPFYRWDRYSQAVKSILEQDEHYQRAVKQNTFTGFVSNEVFNKEFGGMVLRQQSENSLLNLIRIAREYHDKYGGKKLADFYQFSENWHKMAKFIENTDKGMPDYLAAQDAKRWTFDYSDVPAGIEWLRRHPLGTPFITFTYKAIPLLMVQAIRNPVRFWKWPLMFYLIGKLGERGETEEAIAHEKNVMPPYMKSNSALTSIFSPFLRLPITTRQGGHYYFDMTYTMPWGDIGEFDAITGLPRVLMAGGMVMPLVEAGLFNKSRFTNQEIYNDDVDSWLEKRGKQAAYIGRAAVPSMAPGGYGMSRLMSSLKGEPNIRGQVQPPAAAIGQTLFGLKTVPVDVPIEEVQRTKEFRATISDMEGQMRLLSRRYSVGQISESKFKDGMANLIDKRNQRVAKYREVMQ